MTAGFIFGTVGAPLSTPKKPGGTLGAIQQAAALGLSALELGWVRSIRISEEACRMIKQAAVENRISLSVHASYFINLNADSEEWPKSRQRLMDAAYYGYLAGATDIIFHPGSYFGQPKEDVLKRALDRLAGCVEELSRKNISVTLRPETMGKSALIGSLEDVLLMSRQVPGILPCLDFAHLHARTGDGSVNTYQEWIDVLDGYANFIGAHSLSFLHIHLSGIAYSAKGERNHLPLDDSDLNLRDLFRALRDRNCGGRILCESPIMEEDALKMKSLWKRMS